MLYNISQDVTTLLYVIMVVMIQCYVTRLHCNTKSKTFSKVTKAIPVLDVINDVNCAWLT